MHPIYQIFLNKIIYLFASSSTCIQQYHTTINKLRQAESTDSKYQSLQNVIAQTSIKLNKISEQQKLKQIKSYLIKQFQTSKQFQQNTIKQKQRKQYIPNNLVLKKLQFLDKKILMLGVEEENEDHCIYLKKMAEKMGSRIILTALSPDMPYFIKTQLSFVEEWKKFITIPGYSQQCKFYLNPTPHHIEDMCLKGGQKQLVRDSLNKSKEFNQIFYTILNNSKNDNKFVPNALLTPLLINCVQKIYFCDYPLLKERQLWALTIPTQKLRELFEIYHREIYKEKQSFFDPRILFPAKAINKKFQHMVNAIKYATHEATEPAIFVCPAEYTQLFCLQWKKNLPITPYSDFSHELSTQKQTRFIDFVENLVIMDMILQPVIQKYFVQYWSFPFTAVQTLGGKENIGKIFIVWKHFYNLYGEVIKKVPAL